MATPGRLELSIEKRYLVLNQCNYLVLDEADKMIDLGFEETVCRLETAINACQVISIIRHMPSSNIRPENPEDEKENHIYRQTFLFSATMPVQVERLASDYLRNAAYVSIGDRQGKIADTIEQRVLFLTEGQKRRRLCEALQRQDPLIIVFCNSKRSVDELARFLQQEGFHAVGLHGGKIQQHREVSVSLIRL